MSNLLQTFCNHVIVCWRDVDLCATPQGCANRRLKTGLALIGIVTRE